VAAAGCGRIIGKGSGSGGSVGSGNDVQGQRHNSVAISSQASNVNIVN
jgi:hypothetical protein